MSLLHNCETNIPAPISAPYPIHRPVYPPKTKRPHRVERKPRHMSDESGEVRTNQRDGFEDPMSFVYDYCKRNDLPVDPGDSQLERECASRADRAREEYKNRCTEIDNQNDLHGGVVYMRINGHASLSAAEKYGIRLRNNRKSAHASKVFTEVMKRELSKELSKRKEDVSSSCTKIANTCTSADADGVKPMSTLNYLSQPLAEELRIGKNATRDGTLQSQILHTQLKDIKESLQGSHMDPELSPTPTEPYDLISKEQSRTAEKRPHEDGDDITGTTSFPVNHI